MNRLNLWLSISQATREAALLCAAVLVTALALAAASPARADVCPYVTGGRLAFCTDDGTVDLGQQATTHAGQGVYLCLHVNLSDGRTVDATVTDRTTYSAGPGAAIFQTYRPVVIYVPQHADANKQFPLYAIYHDPCKNVNWTFTVSVHVIP